MPSPIQELTISPFFKISETKEFVFKNKHVFLEKE
jgi:hypothetical protein